MARDPNITGANPTERRPSTEGGGDVRTFRCADVGFADCRWEVTGRTEDELMPKIEQHGREAHSIRTVDEPTRNRIRNAIRERAA